MGRLVTDQTDVLTREIDGIALPIAGTYVIDTSFSQIGFAVRHLMVSRTRGTFKSYRGTVVIAEDPTQSTMAVTVDLASIDTHDESRDEHLRSDAFFDVEQFPEMLYRSTGVRHDRGGRWLVDGEVTLHGVTKPMRLEVTFEGAVRDQWGKAKLGFSASGELNRDDFGLNWNMPLEAGGVAVGKKVTVEIEAELVAE
jgi:polyisoprenoid-binding protein YceI